MAKIRLGFVTNSSSSSFIIAKHKDCTYEEVLDLVKANRKNVEDLLELLEYEEDEEMDVESAITEIAKELFRYADGSDFKLGDWIAISEEFSCEDGELFPTAMYEFGYQLNSEHIKVG